MNEISEEQYFPIVEKQKPKQYEMYIANDNDSSLLNLGGAEE